MSLTEKYEIGPYQQVLMEEYYKKLLEEYYKEREQDARQKCT